MRKGIVQTQRGQLSSALESYNRAVELNPDDATALVNRGLVKDELSDYDGAVADYSKAIELDFTLTEAYYNRANTYHNQKQYALAIEDYSLAIALKSVSEYQLKAVTAASLRQLLQTKPSPRATPH